MIDIDSVREAIIGPVTSLSTVFNKDGSIDYNGVRNCIDFWIEESKSGTILITNGDSLYSILTDKEVAELTKVAVEQTAGRAMVVAAAKPWWLGKAIEFARFSKEAGADVLMVLPPDWAHSCASETITGYCLEISKEIPVMIVTHLGTRGVPLDSFEKILEKNSGIVAIKDDFCGDYGKRVACLVKGRIPFLSGGRKINHLEIMPFGADGYLSVYARFKPIIAHKYWKHISSGDIEKAVEIIEAHDIPYIDFAEKSGVDFDAQIHASMELFGIAKRWRRRPYYNLNNEQMEKLKDFHGLR